ncbi:DUF4270 domain-containing protein [Winogradskyella sp.]|uniref:DUF4270 domain-containing protein n=1 Tax=Winogradskyella sp. TaxID=1883156 RepID=UPI002617C2B7|nr:DUF4270 domain-containing protein [Winogradskyella sp.]
MKRNKIALQILVFILITLSFIACDNDFSTLESDAINDGVATNFDIVDDTYDIITYTNTLGPVQTNGLVLNTLGLYDDETYGRVESDFVTQLTLTNYAPDFGDDVQIDSVALYIPYFFSITEIDEDENIIYDVDSIIGMEPISLSLYESNYFIRDFDPNGEFSERQAYFSNRSASPTEMISDAALEHQELTFVDYDDEGNMFVVDNIIEINDEGYILRGPEPPEEEDEEVEASITRLPPGMRIMLEPTFWQDKIINQQEQAVLSNENNFLEYFRGLYFKAETINDTGSFLFLSMASTATNITIYYSRLTESTTDDETAREQASFEMRFAGNSINFLDNDFNMSIPDGDPDTGDARLFLKGGEGSIARIKLFNGEDLDDDDDTMNTFEEWKNEFVETDAEGKFVRAKRLINEANLVFYVDQDMVNGGEPDRLYLYDIDNKAPLTDFFIDITNNTLPSFSKLNHLGPLQRVNDEPNGDGIKYKFRLTEHLNNLLLRDSTNVELGLSVSLNVNLEGPSVQREVQTADDSDLRSPISSVMSPRGTVLHGNNTEDESKKVYLEIFYTEPNN